ncbi:hypothetical protein COOONC_03430 [Cooperia oncophora]
MFTCHYIFQMFQGVHFNDDLEVHDVGPSTMSTSTFLRQKGMAWNSLARTFGCEEELGKDDAMVMNELLNLCSFWSDSEPIFRGPDDDSDEEDDSDDDLESFEHHIAMLAQSDNSRFSAACSETLSCLSKSSYSSSPALQESISAQMRPSSSKALENAFKGIVSQSLEMKRRKVDEEHNSTLSEEGGNGVEDWSSVKESVLNPFGRKDWRKTLLSYLRSQKDDVSVFYLSCFSFFCGLANVLILDSCTRKVLKGVDFQFLTQIMASYTATTSEEDRTIYEALDLLENTYKVNMNIISPIVWGEKSVEVYKKRGQYGGTLIVLTPDRTVMTDVDEETPDSKILYDVRFLSFILEYVMHPDSRLAYCVLAEVLSLLHRTSIVDTAADRYINLSSSHLIRILNEYRSRRRPRLPHILSESLVSVVSHFFARVSKLILHPESPVYTAVLSFFILKPVIDLSNVPEIYKMLLSSSTDYHKQEREWMLTLILEGLIEPKDYNVLQNRSGIKLLLALFPTCMIDMVSRRLILSILKAAVRMPSVAHDLFYRMNSAYMDSFYHQGARMADAAVIPCLSPCPRFNAEAAPNLTSLTSSVYSRRGCMLASILAKSEEPPQNSFLLIPGTFGSFKFQNRDLSVWEQCYLGQIYSILIENERKNCRSAKGDASRKSHLVALASVRMTARVVLYVMEGMSDKSIAVENVQSIKATIEAKWRPKRKKQEPLQ